MWSCHAIELLYCFHPLFVLQLRYFTLMYNRDGTSTAVSKSNTYSITSLLFSSQNLYWMGDRNSVASLAPLIIFRISRDFHSAVTGGEQFEIMNEFPLCSTVMLTQHTYSLVNVQLFPRIVWVDVSVDLWPYPSLGRITSLEVPWHAGIHTCAQTARAPTGPPCCRMAKTTGTMFGGGI